jgi:four helix bundle protein
MNKVNSFRELEVYQLGFEIQQKLFECSKGWPRQEDYSLTDQIRRSSRSIGANLAESWAKRRYPAHFLSKLTDADGELQETFHWLDSARACGYIPEAEYQAMLDGLAQVGRLLGSMINRHESFCFK